MSWKNSLFILLSVAVFFSCKDKPSTDISETATDRKHLIPHNSPLLQTGDPSIVLVDFRKPEAYLTSHIPGAIQLYRNDFQDTTLPYPGMRIDKKMTAERLGKAGITEKHTIVVYDDKGSPDASRFWWLLNLYNFDQVYLLDGGITHWKNTGGKTSSVISEIKPAIFHFSEGPERALLIEKEELLKLISSDKSEVVVLDARSWDEYSGRSLKEGAKKAGRIPKSIHIDWAEAIDFGNSHTFKPKDQLEKIYAKLGASREDTIVVYCHSGVRSSHTTFVLTQLLDYKNVLNYDGSWVEWSYDDELPYETDPITN